MKYLTLTWGEQQDLLEEGINKGKDICMSCLRLIGEGLSDEEIAGQLGYDLPDIQKTISEARALLASLSR